MDMDCLFTPCRAKTGPESERFISCWLCDRFGHAKCAGITGRAADAVLDPSKGLRWSCPDCRKRDIDFYKLFTETRNCFSDLSKNLGSVWEKFELIKTRFDECRYISQSSSSPANVVSTRSVACGSSPPKSVSLVQVSDSLKATNNVSVSATAESVFTETWLKPVLHSSELFHNSFQVFRNDRLYRNGGGVLIAISTALPTYSFEFPTTPDVEFIAIRVKLPNKHLYLTCSYIPPNSDISVYKKQAALICEVAKQSKPTDIVLALGDFNLPQVNWFYSDCSGCLIPSSTSDKAVVFFNELFDNNLVQYNGTPNCNGRFLDLCFANFPEVCVNRCFPFSLPEDPYHPALGVSFHYKYVGLLNLYNVPNSNFSYQRYDFHKINVSILKSHLSHFVLDFSEGSIDSLLSSFYNVLNQAISASVPIKQPRPRSKDPPWFNKTIKYYKNRKNKLFKKFSKSGSSFDYFAYSVARHKFNSLNRQYYCRYLQFVKSSLFSNLKYFFKFVNSKRKISINPSFVSFNGSESSDDFESSNLFAEYFRQNFSTANFDLSENYPYSISNSVSIPNFVISENDVFEGLNSLKYNCSPGPDGIPSCVLISCAGELCDVISKIFNKSLNLVGNL
ncbi:uncharacterized protein ACN427_007570 [Glossina fuscipes fuscipes]